MWSWEECDILLDYGLRDGGFLMRRRNTPYTNENGKGYKKSR